MLAIVGPGRVGQALGRRLLDAGEPLLGVLGRTIQSSGAAVRFLGAGSVLDSAAQLAAADLVMIAVDDDRLGEVVAHLASGCPGPRLWFHTSGGHDLSLMAPLVAVGAMVASVHPLCPVADPERGYQSLLGQPAVIEADAESAARLEALFRRAGLQPFCLEAATDGEQRRLYHAACVLASNGFTALFELAEALLDRALPGVDARSLVFALTQSALTACKDHGAIAALSGPAIRGDAGTMSAQLQQLRALAADPGADLLVDAAPVYTALLQHAARMAGRRGAISQATLGKLLAAIASHA